MSEELIDTTPEKRKRGRPATGKAISAQERKRQQRRRSFEEFCVHINDVNLNSVSLTAMLEHIPKAVKLGRVDLVEKIMLRIVKITKGNTKVGSKG